MGKRIGCAAMSAAPPTEAVIGVLLAGGLGRRIGGDKAVVELEGRPLALYGLEALHEACEQVVVVAKRDTMLPPPAGVARLLVRARQPPPPPTRGRPPPRPPP